MASEPLAGTYVERRPTLWICPLADENIPPLWNWYTYEPSTHFHSRYLLTLVYSRIFTKFPKEVRGEDTVGHDELGDEVDVPVAVVAVLFGRFLAVAEDLVEVGDVDRGAVTAVVVVAVYVQHLLPLHRKQPRQDALLQSCPAHYHIVLLVHNYILFAFFPVISIR